MLKPNEDGKLLLMTPVDPVFLLIPIVRAVYKVGAPLSQPCLF